MKFINCPVREVLSAAGVFRRGGAVNPKKAYTAPKKGIELELYSSLEV